MIDITCLSDCHGFLPSDFPGGDILIVAGDLTASDKVREYYYFFDWIEEQKYTKKIVIAGNHDNVLQNNSVVFRNATFQYLCDSGTEFDGLKIWGSPWTKSFQGMNPMCKAFCVDTEEELANKFALIPDDIDILITHSPPFGILDGIPMEDGSEFHAGSTALRDAIKRIQPRAHFFGHIHENGSCISLLENVLYVNASHVDEKYRPVHEPVMIRL